LIDTFQLRCSIIRLALSGKLTTQFQDENAKNILAKISSSKKLEKKEKIPYDIPDNWCWARLSDIYDINPKVQAEPDKTAAFIPMEKISDGFNRDYLYDVQTWEKASKNHTKFSDGDVAFAKISPCFENRKSFIAENLPNGIGGGTTELIILRQPNMLPDYTYLLIIDQRFIKAGSRSYKGTVGQQRITGNFVYEYVIPVAPIEEQRRIVKIVNEAFTILNTIDILQVQYETNVEVLKSKLIDAGIQGNLTEQLPEDGTAEEVYIDVNLNPITAEEKKFSIPNTWSWIRLGWAMEIERGGSPRPIKTFMTDSDDGINWIKIGDVEKNGKYILQTKEKIKPEGEKKSRKVYPGDFLLTNSMSFGRPYISKIEGCIHDGWLLLRNSKQLFDLDYLYWLLSSKYVYNQFLQKASGATVDNLNKEKVASAVIPLPPIKEQKRIADRIDKILQII
jgi:type I restriction enzyme S subunit